MKKLITSSGFSMVETLVGVSLLFGLGLGVMKISQTQSGATVKLKTSDELSRDMITIRQILSDPRACNNNFQGKQVNTEKGTIISGLKNVKGEEQFKTVSKTKSVSYELKEISLGQFIPITQRARVSFSFARIQNGKEQEVKRFVHIFVKVDGTGKIEECINSGEQAAESLLAKFCRDLDPDLLALNEDCADNYGRLLAQTKKAYCDEHPMLEYVEATGKCKPLDAGVNCNPGEYFRGYDENGEKICYNGIPTPPPVCSTWDPPTPNVNTICDGVPFTQTQKCSTSTETKSFTAIGTKTTGCLNCTIAGTVSWTKTKCMGCTGSIEFDRIRDCTCDASGPVTIANGSSHTFSGTGTCETEMNGAIESTSTASGSISYSCNNGVLTKGVGTCAP